RVWSATSAPCPWTPFTGGDGALLNNGINLVVPVGINNNNNHLPSAYKLEQNYPNPFNPVTNISYSIPKSGKVKLSVFDMLGREVAVLANDYKSAGSYSVEFDASNLSSGVYL